MFDTQYRWIRLFTELVTGIPLRRKSKVAVRWTLMVPLLINGGGGNQRGNKGNDANVDLSVILWTRYNNNKITNKSGDEDKPCTTCSCRTSVRRKFI